MLSRSERDIQDELTAVSNDLEALLSVRDHQRAKPDLVWVPQSLERGAKGRRILDDSSAHSRQTTAEHIGKAGAAILDEAAEPMHVMDIRAALSSFGQRAAPGARRRRERDRTSVANARFLRKDRTWNVRTGEVDPAGVESATQPTIESRIHLFRGGGRDRQGRSSRR